MKEKKSWRVAHLGRPAEPWGKLGEVGKVLAARPGRGYIPACAYVQWDAGYSTWEKCSDLRLGARWDAVRNNLSESRRSTMIE